MEEIVGMHIAINVTQSIPIDVTRYRVIVTTAVYQDGQGTYVVSVIIFYLLFSSHELKTSVIFSDLMLSGVLFSSVRLFVHMHACPFVSFFNILSGNEKTTYYDYCYAYNMQ